MAGDEKVSSMIEALSTMLNAAMARDERPYVELREELRYVDAYLYIISVRFGKRLQVERDIDESLLGQLVPRLVMQPIVENAVDHGVAGKRMGRLRLHIYREGARIMLEVENDNPLSEQDAATIEALLSWDGDERPSGGSGHIGIRNVQLRLKMLYGEAYGLSILPGGLGTIARITLPYRPEQRPS